MNITLFARVFAVSVIIFGFSTQGHADAITDNNTLIVEEAYSMATTSVQKNGAAFFKITNNANKDQSIIAAESPIAEKTELHTHIMDGDIMMMREVEAYDIPAGQSVILKPMGHHIMLMGLKEPLKAGDSYPLTLTNDKEEEFTITVNVKNPADVPMGGMMENKH